MIKSHINNRYHIEFTPSPQIPILIRCIAYLYRKAHRNSIQTAVDSWWSVRSQIRTQIIPAAKGFFHLVEGHGAASVLVVICQHYSIII